MPLVSRNPWNRRPNSFSPDVVHRRRIDGFGCLLKSLYAANFFNSSSQMDPPAMAKCCNINACNAPLYPLVNGDVVVVLGGTGGVGVGRCVCLCVAPFGVGIYKL